MRAGCAAPDICFLTAWVAVSTHFTSLSMTLLLLEALAALLIFVFIVWWTMFSGRNKGELPADAEQDKAQPPVQQPVPAAKASQDKPEADTAPRA